MSTAWLHIDISILPYGLDLPDGTKALKAEVSDEGRVIGILVDHDDIPAEADWVSAQFVRAKDGPVQFDRWVVIPNTSDAQRIEAGTDETLQAAQPVGREPDGEADAPENKAVDPYALGGGK